MAYRAATYGFRNQRLSEMISLALPSTEHSHALKPSGSPIKVTNIEIMIKFWFLSWCYCSSNWVGMRIIVYKCVWNKVFRHCKQLFTSFHSIALLRLWYMIRLKFYKWKVVMYWHLNIMVPRYHRIRIKNDETTPLYFGFIRWGAS